MTTTRIRPPHRTRRRPASTEPFSPAEKAAFHERVMEMRVEFLPINELVEPARKYRNHGKRQNAARWGRCEDGASTRGLTEGAGRWRTR